MLDKEKIKEIIRQNRDYLLWDLKLKQQYGNDVAIAFFNGDLFKPEQSQDDKIEQSINALENALELYKDIPNQTFSLTLKRSKTSNGDKGFLGPYYFTYFPANMAGNGLNGLPVNAVPGIGFVPQDIMDMRIGAITETFSKKMELMLQELELKREKEKLQELLKKTEEDRIKYNDAGEKGMLAFQKLAEAGINRFLKEGDLAGFLPNKNSEKNEEAPKSEEEQIVEEMATNIFSKVKNKADLEGLKAHIDKILTAYENGQRNEKTNNEQIETKGELQ